MAGQAMRNDKPSFLESIELRPLRIEDSRGFEIEDLGKELRE